MGEGFGMFGTRKGANQHDGSVVEETYMAHVELLVARTMRLEGLLITNPCDRWLERAMRATLSTITGVWVCSSCLRILEGNTR